MDHKKLYSSIIVKALNENRTKDSNRYELHHIIPKSLGGDENINNLVYLTFREHYLSHYLLSKIHSDSNKLVYAFWAMNNQRKRRTNKLNSKLYEYARKRVSIIMKHSNKCLGNKHSSETKRLMSEQATGRYHHGFKGYYITPWGKFESSKLAAKANKLSDVSINRWCKNGRNLILSKQRYYQNTNLFSEDDIDKSLYDLGFDFEPAGRIIPTKQGNPKKDTSGVSHHSFKGYYITPWGKFESEAEGKRVIGLKIKTRCMNNLTKMNKMTIKNHPNLFKKEDIGKTYKELGFYFEKIYI